MPGRSRPVVRSGAVTELVSGAVVAVLVAFGGLILLAPSARAGTAGPAAARPRGAVLASPSASSSSFVLGSASLAPLATADSAGSSIPAPTSTAGRSTDTSTDGGVATHLVGLFLGAIAVGVVLLVLGVIGLVVTRDGRRGRHR